MLTFNVMRLLNVCHFVLTELYTWFNGLRAYAVFVIICFERELCDHFLQQK